MFALASPELENKLLGLVLMDSAPNASWQSFFMEYGKNHPLAEAEKLQKIYEKNPSNDLLRELTIACAPYFSLSTSLDKIIEILASLPFNYKSHLWAENNSDLPENVIKGSCGATYKIWYFRFLLTNSSSVIHFRFKINGLV
jgi:hypothetical protein